VISDGQEAHHHHARPASVQISTFLDARRQRSLGEDVGHEGTELQRSEMVRFFDKYLMGIPERPIDLAVEATEPRDLM